MNRLDLTMSALAHPARRAILERLMRREARVTELAAPFAMSLTAVSKHIRILERARLVRRRRVWREHLVSFSPEPFDEVTEWIEKTRAFWNARLDALEELLRAEDAAQTREQGIRHGRSPTNPPRRVFDTEQQTKQKSGNSQLRRRHLRQSEKRGPSR